MFGRSYLGAQGQNDRRHDHYTVSTCNFIVGVDGDARVLVIMMRSSPMGHHLDKPEILLKKS